MKISAIKTFMFNAIWRNWIFVKVETDKGIYGWGEASLEGNEPAVEAAVKTMTQYFIGKDPRDIELHWNTVYRNSYWRPSLVISSALGGIEIALWDILGKSLDVPVYRLLGGVFRERIPAYNNAWYFNAGTPEDFARAATKVVDLGFKYLKWDPFWATDLFIEPEKIAEAKACVGAVREAVGPDVQLLIECHGRFSPDWAIKIAREIEEYKPYFFEEPVPPDNIEACIRVARSINIPVATGERMCTHLGRPPATGERRRGHFTAGHHPHRGHYGNQETGQYGPCLLRPDSAPLRQRTGADGGQHPRGRLDTEFFNPGIHALRQAVIR